jgi:hypothetical protein
MFWRPDAGTAVHCIDLGEICCKIVITATLSRRQAEAAARSPNPEQRKSPPSSGAERSWIA